MFYVYTIKSDCDHSYYVGSTNDLRRRLIEHNTGQSRYTRNFMPWKLIYYEAYQTRRQAYNREMMLKQRARAWQELIKRIERKAMKG